MGNRNIKVLFYAVGLFAGITSALYASDLFRTSTVDLSEFSAFTEVLPPSASITGTTTVCLNESPQPQITFTGSGGDTPYEFTYTLNGGANQTISTTGTNTSVTLNVNTGTAGSYVYALVSVTDGANDTSSANGSATVTVANPPTVSFTYNNGGCSATPVSFNSTVTGNGHFTVAPGQFPYQNQLDNATSDSYNLSGITGEIYIIAHGVVCYDDDNDNGGVGPF